MSVPAYDSTKHDISIDGIGYMWQQVEGAAAPVALQRLDAEPATKRTAVGEGTNENFTLSAFFFQNDLEGGVGQLKLASADRALSAIADTTIQGHAFPPKKVLTTGSTGGGTYGYFRQGSTLYGHLATTIENIATGASTAGSNIPRLGQKTKVSGTGAAFWVSEDNELMRVRPAGVIVDLENNLPGGITPYAVDLSGRFLWCLGTQTLSSTFQILQSVEASYTESDAETSVNLAFDNVPRASSVLLLVVLKQVQEGTYGVAIDAAAMASTWTTLFGGVAGSYVTVYMLANPGPMDRFLALTRTTLKATAILALEVSGFDPTDLVLDQVSSVSEFETATGAQAYALGSVSAQAGHLLAMIVAFPEDHVNDDLTAFGTPTNHTDIATWDLRSTAPPVNSTFWGRVSYRAATTDTTVAGSATWSGISAVSSERGALIGALLKLRPTTLDSDIEQTTLLASSDDGESWTQLANVSAGMPLPISTLASQGSLWVTTETGLYEIVHEDSETSDSETITAAIRGPMDEFHYPLDADAIGTALAAFDGSLYYNLGATLRRFPPGGRAEQIWPPRGWGQGGGTILSITSGEGGIYFGTDNGFLWRYDGLGFHQLAKATAEQLSVLHWHAGKLYLAGDPAPYLEYGYPSLRPDVYAPGPTTYDVGYIVSSMLEMEAVGEPKVVEAFETHAEFSAGATAAESGTYKLQYLIADSGQHPDRYAPDSSTPTWVDIGTHSVADGLLKEHTLATPITFKRLYLRAVLTPGTLGIPIWEGWGIDGEVLMRRRVRLVAMLSIATDTVNRSGEQMYADEGDVAAALDRLERLRDRRHANYTPYFEVVYRLTGGETKTLTCLGEKLDDWLESHQGMAGALSFAGAAFVMRELP